MTIVPSSSGRLSVSWAALQLQFGADYAQNAVGTRNFKKAFLKHLKAVSLVYPEAKVENGSYGLVLRPSPTHIAEIVNNQ